MDYKEAFYELKKIFDSAKEGGQLDPVKIYANSLQIEAEQNELAQNERLEAEKKAKIEDEPDVFKKINMKYMTAQELTSVQDDKDPFEVVADKYL